MTCKFHNCTNRLIARGLCTKHYQQRKAALQKGLPWQELQTFATYTADQCDNGDRSSWIPLHDKSHNLVARALVDTARWQELMQSRWFLADGYAQTKIKGRNYKMHRIVVDCPEGLQVDHLNHDRLDNRNSNLRIVTARQNSENHSHRQFRGTTLHRSTGKWIAQVSVNYENHYLGVYETREEAASVAREFRKLHMTNSND